MRVCIGPPVGTSVIFSVTYFEIAVEFKSRKMLQSRYIALAILRTEKFKISDD